MPRAPKQCGAQGCPERVVGVTYCAQHEREYRERTAARNSSSSWGRGSTRQSRRTRALVLAAWPTCYLGYDGCTIRSTEDDHVIPVSQGGSDAMFNRRGACQHCHRIKSQAEAAHGRRQAIARRESPR